jgi:DNA-binding NarL/FixJ family response regulator
MTDERNPTSQHAMPHRTKTALPFDPTVPPLFNREEWCETTDRVLLSPRQAQVVGLVIQSYKDKEIAALLDISHATVRTHICQSKSRLVASDRVGLAYRMFWAFRHTIEPKRYPWIQGARSSD